jgi:hypothetical protein
MLEVKTRHNEVDRDSGPPFHGARRCNFRPAVVLFAFFNQGGRAVIRDDVDATWVAHGFEVVEHRPEFYPWPGRPMTQQLFLLRKL